MTQIKIGNTYEKLCCELLDKKGYWCHIFAKKPEGQPCDIIALNNDKIFLIDSKHTFKKVFSTKDIEPNQVYCFQRAKNKGIKNCGFAIYFEEEKKFYWLSFEKLDLEKSSYSPKELILLEELL